MALDFSKPYNPKGVEERVYKRWEDSGYFNPDKLPPRLRSGQAGKRTKTFSISMAPPNITGSLHMGHALEYALSDILVRFKRMSAHKTLWLPGVDHAGIAAQNVVEKDLKKRGLTRHQLGREEFLKQIWQWKEKYGHIIIGQLKSLGVSADWSRLRFTMDEEYQAAVAEAFIRYFKKDWIYRGERVINWCPKCQTSLSDLELEYEEEKGNLWFIKYPLINLNDKISISNYIVVATTRPETMLGDSAVAVNPRDARYKSIIGQKVLLPIKNREIPVISDKRIEQDFGTGAVKITPAHDLLDAEIGRDHKLPVYKVIGEDGKMTFEAGSICSGLKTDECRQKVVDTLEHESLIEKIEEFAHNIARCYRCRSVIEPMPSMQWFLKMGGLAKLARLAVKSGQVKFYPKRFEKTYFDWLKNIRDWTISRQIWWGHRLPVWEHDKICVPKPGSEKDIEKCVEFVIAKKEPKCQYCDAGYKQVADVLDTWFSSALWPFATLGWPKPTKDLKTFYPTDALTNDRGIINLWDARMIFSGLEFMKKSPFRDLVIHATVLTKEGKRMSKSLGTGIDPINLIEQYGADAVRFALVWQAMGGQDIRWSEEALVAGKKFLNKIWNATRFVLERSGSPGRMTGQTSRITSKTDADKKILTSLKKITANTSKKIDKYEFGSALHDIYEFFWHDFCDIYLEASKKQMDDTIPQDNTARILSYVLETSLKLLHPFLPYITEEIWSAPQFKKKDLLMVEAWPR
ncbi:MAG: valine--tRNA ligase [Candidatus Niyogibacteria bacterium]|nr:MAG: valine--tRNA ligase [Candidatus Niyogibacteria bacterium]